MNVIEIFDSIDGEGIFAGELATFIRLSGCNLRCRYCDTGYALQEGSGKEMTIPEIIVEVNKIGNKHITLTGGEPLIHKDVKTLIEGLISYGYQVNIETNGSVPIDDYLSRHTIITLDYKTAGSGEESKMLLENWDKLRSCDVVKIVCYEDDLPSIEELLSKHKTKAQIFLSPVFGKIEPSELVEFSKDMRDYYGINDIRVQLQMHKYIWKPDERGV
jgi:7-carboxy-7-deazaguanine synthase